MCDAAAGYHHLLLFIHHSWKRGSSQLALLKTSVSPSMEETQDQLPQGLFLASSQGDLNHRSKPLVISGQLCFKTNLSFSDKCVGIYELVLKKGRERTPPGMMVTWYDGHLV